MNTQTFAQAITDEELQAAGGGIFGGIVGKAVGKVTAKQVGKTIAKNIPSIGDPRKMTGRAGATALTIEGFNQIGKAEFGSDEEE